MLHTRAMSVGTPLRGVTSIAWLNTSLALGRLAAQQTAQFAGVRCRVLGH